MKFQTLSTVAAAAIALSITAGVPAQAAAVPSFGLPSLSLLSLNTLPLAGGVPGVPSVSVLSLGTLTNALGTTGVPSVSLLSLGTLTNVLGTSGVPGTPTLPGMPTSINGLPMLPGTTDLNGYLVYLNQDLNGMPVPTRLNTLFSNSPIAPPAPVPDFPTFGAQSLADMNLPVLSGLVGQLIVLNRGSYVPVGAIPALPSLPSF